MKKMIVFVTVVVSLTVLADTWTDPETGITWTYTVSDSKAQIGTGSSWDSAISPLTVGAITIPEALGELPVTSVSRYAFNGCRELTSVIVSDGIKNIESQAFQGCSKLTSVTLPSSVENIGISIFSGCSGLMSVTVNPDNLYYSSTEHALFSKDKKLLMECFNANGDLVIPQGVTSIGNCAFSECSGLKSVEIPSSVTNIGYSAFSRCRGLTSVEIPESVTVIGSGAFYGCSGLISLKIPSGVTSIEDIMFYGCNELTTVTIPDGVTSIGDKAFYNCTSLTSATIPNSVTNIGESAFYRCMGLRSVSVPPSVTRIRQEAFWGCTGLNSIEMPLCIERMGWYFSVASLTNIEFTAGTTIASNFLAGCTLVEAVKIPSSVSRIERDAFKDTKLYADAEDGLVIVDDCLIGFKGERPSELTIPTGVRVVADGSLDGFDFCDKFGVIEKTGENLAGKKFRRLIDSRYHEVCEDLDAVEQEIFREATGAPSEIVYAGSEGYTWRRFSWDVLLSDFGTGMPDSQNWAVDEDGNDYYDDHTGTWCHYWGCWYVGGMISNVTPNAVRTAPIDELNSSGTLKVTVDGPGTLSFGWGVSRGELVVPEGVRTCVDGVVYDREEERYAGTFRCYVDGEFRVEIDVVNRSQLDCVTMDGDGQHEVKWVYEYEGAVSVKDDCFGYVGDIAWTKEGEEVPKRSIDAVLLAGRFEPFDWSDESIMAYGFCETYEDGYTWRGYKPSAYVFTEDGFPICRNAYSLAVEGYNVEQEFVPGWGYIDTTTITPGTATIRVSASHDLLDGEVSKDYDIQYGGDIVYEGSSSLLVVATSNQGDAETHPEGNGYIWDSGGVEWTGDEMECVYNGQPVSLDIDRDYNSYVSPYSYQLVEGDPCGYRVYRADQDSDWWGDWDVISDGQFFYWSYEYGYWSDQWKGPPISIVDAGKYVVEFPEWYGTLDEWREAYFSQSYRHTRNGYTFTITIHPLDVRDAGLSLISTNLVYNGEEQQQDVLLEGFDGDLTIEVTGGKETCAGEYSLHVVGTGNFCGEVDIPYTIEAKGLDEEQTKITVADAIYWDGKFKTVSVEVRDRDRAAILTEGVDYVVKYDDNINPGVATVSVIGTNNYCGTITRQWTILAREDAEIVGAWSEPRTFEYDGKVHGVDYSARLDVMDWPLNVVTQGTIRAVNVGEYAATARAETVGVPETDSVYYRCAAVTNECNWTITPKPVTKLQIDYVSTAMIANGQQQRPQIVVRDVERGVVLTSADYAVAYENNVEPGMGVARITGSGNYGGETTIEFPIVAGVSPSEGLNMDSGTFEIVGETDWVADNVVTHDGYASMRSGAIGNNETSTLTAVVHGAGTVSFWWKVSSQRFDSVLELDRLEFYVDGVRQKWVNGDVDWTKLSFKVDGAGPHELKWIYAKDGSISERQDCGWVDEVSWEKEWLIGDWLNDVDREFATSDVKWSPDASVNSDGVGSMRSGSCQQGQKSVLSTVAENVGTLTFKWKCSCVAYEEYITDKLSLLIDGVPVRGADGKDIFINGETGWSDVSYRITGAGRHEVQWVFEKVSDASMGQNCGWVDVVRWNNEPGTLTDEDLVVDAFDGVYDGQGHGAVVAVKGVQNASVKYGASRETIGDAESPTFANCGEHEVWFAVNVPDFNEYVGKTIVRIRPRSIETGEVTLGESLVYTGLVLTQTVSSVVVDGLAATFDVSDNTACAAGAYQLSVAGTGNFCGELSVSFAIAKAQAPLGDVTVEGYSAEAGAVEFTYDGEAHQPTVAVGYDGAAVVRFALTEDGPYGDVLDVSNAVERLDVWYEILSANFERLVGQTQMTIRPKSIEGGAVVLGPQISDVDGRVVQTVASVTADGLDATFEVEDNAVDEVGDYELTVRGTGNFTGSIVVSYSVAGIVLPPVLTPGDGTVFTDLVTIVFSNQTEGAKHYFTTNGVNPDTSSLTVKRIRLNRKTTIKAFSVLEGSLRSAMVEATYAFGYCQTPVVRLQDCESDVFNFQNQMVVVDWNEADGVLRYTVDGSDPTTESAVYEGPFAISASTTVKAKVFSDRFFDSEVVTGDFRYERLTVAAPVVTAADEFTGTSTKVGMSCATEGAVIRYTLDGSEPTGDSVAYLEPFDVPCELGKSVEIKVRAFCDGYDSSEIVTTEVRRIWGYGDAIGVPDWQFASDEGSAAWFAVTNVTGEGEIALRSGVAQDGGKSSLKTRVSTAGTLTFNWMADTEESLGLYDWDHAEFRVDGVPVAWIDGQWTGWITVKCELIQSDCGHELEWVYTKDEMDSEWGDTVYLSDVRMSNDDISPNLPSVVGDENAKVMGDAETGFVVKPSEGNTAVEVTIPQGVDAAKVTVEVSVKVVSVKPSGAKVKIVNAGADITEFLNVPAADGNGVVDLTRATVKEEIVKETMDPAKGAEIKLNAANPTLITPNTRKGLFYQLREGETLDGMKAGDSKVGDGEPWKPEIKVKGGNSAFYSIGVGKGE